MTGEPTYGLAVDCIGHPAGAQVVADGFEGIALYVGTPGRKKAPTRQHVADYLANGLKLILIYEDTTGSWRLGRVRGAADAVAVRAHLADLGIDWAQVSCVYFAFDEDVTAAELPIAREYAAGVASAFGSTARVGAYGGSVVLKDLLDRDLIGWAWASAGWQHGHMDQRCVLQQQVKQINVGGVPCDIDVILQPDFGQYPAPFSPTNATAAGPPATRTSEDAVSLLQFDPTPLPDDPPGGRWQDTDPASWPRSFEQRTALVPALSNGAGWRGRGSISSITVGWAGDQDGPDASGRVKPSGFLEYMRVFYFGDQGYQQWLARDLVLNVPLIGNRSLPAAALPDWSTFLVVRYAAPGGLFLGIEYEH